MKILVVEDEIVFSDLYRIFLQSKGHEVTIALDGQQGVNSYLRNAPFDLVITDYRMPKKDGFNVIKEILSVNQDQEFILATAYNIEKEHQMNTINATRVQILKKPFDFDELEIMIGKVVQKQNNISA
jgi:DNA-binding response OmpR family regulator